MRRSAILILLFTIFVRISGQVIINEASNKNASQIQTAKGEYHDWIELYNAGIEVIDLSDYYLSDEKSDLLKWKFPTGISIDPQAFILVFASGVNDQTVIQTPVHHWETAVYETDTWRWINPNPSTPVNWKDEGFDDISWNSGTGGFGFADGDDNTVYDPANVSVYIRKEFNITDESKIVDAVLHIDYDDGFIAYLNGTEIARANLNDPVSWNTNAPTAIEAKMYQGQNPTEFKPDMNTLKSLLHNGSNTLAIECHNAFNSSDMTLRPFLSFGLSDNSNQFGQVPLWFNLPGNQMPNNLEATFKISSGGETIYLSNGSMQVADSLVIPNLMPVNYSIGSATDGSSVRAIFINATPYASNNSQTAYIDGFEPKPTISKSAGIYPSGFVVSIVNNSVTSEIRYTLDGQIPTIGSTLYTGPISIDTTRVLKAIAFSTTDKLTSAVAVATYILEVNPTNAAVLSISGEDEDFFGPSGLIQNWWSDNKKPCYIEFFNENNHQLVVSQNSGIKVDGGAGGSRSNPQTSFRIEPGNPYFGEEDINYNLIPTVARSSYETFYIRNGSNQYMYYPCKDAIETSVLGNNTKNNYSAYAPVNVYINGEYWGYYELREKQDEDYFKQHYNIDEKKLELLSLSYWYNSELRSVAGDSSIQHFLADYNSFISLNTSSSDFWNNGNKYFDLEYYTDYICAQSWIADTDWPFNNIKIFRGPETGKRWRFGLVDVEWALNPNGWTSSTFNHIDFMINYDPGMMYIHLWQKAMLNQQYKNYFINRFCDLMNTVWLPENTSKIANDIYSITRPELQRSFQRWGQGNLGNTDAAHQTMIQEFKNRTTYVRQHIQTAYNLTKKVNVTLDVKPAGAGVVKISTVTPGLYPWSGYYFDGVPVTVEAIPNPGYKFDKWNANSILTDLSNAVFNGNINADASFTANFLTSENSEQLVISEINYNSVNIWDAGDWFEIWNYSPDLEANLTGWYISDSDPLHKFIFPSNTIIQPGERLVVVSNNFKFSNLYPGIRSIGDLGFNLSNSGDEISLFNANNELITKVAWTDQDPWPTGPDGSGTTLELLNSSVDPQDPASWFEGCPGGSPGTEYTSPCAPLAVKEIENELICRIYPNPANNKLFIQFESKQVISRQIEIINMDGKIVNSNTAESNLKILDVSDLMDGIYLIKVKEGKKIDVFRFIVKK
ncbi:MAG: lamin tail domain-containing protein [Bacteroidales bacterium]